jgi:hypothetical protein
LEGSPLQGTQKVLEMFMNENYPVIFVINKSTNEDDNGKSSDIKSTIKFLKNNGLNKLAIIENIICCNLVKSKKCLGYGIGDIFKRIFDILAEKNKFYFDNEITKKLKECNEKIKLNLNAQGKEKDYEKYLDDSIEIKKNLSLKNELFEKYNDEEYLIKEGKKNAQIQKNKFMFLTASQAYIPIPYTDLALTPILQTRMVYLIFNGYGISLFELDLKNVATFLLEGGTREIGHLGNNYYSKKFFTKTAKGCLVEFSKLITKKQGKKLLVNH